jgi:hypothetical protein
MSEAAESHEFTGSSNLVKARYDEAAGELRVTFKGNATYAYREVTRETWDAFTTAPSAGSFLASSIKPSHPCERVS